ncbi:MAG: alpha/beta hydrolase [Phycisphaerae bacterium]|nr:alpha/beta hydrolase [Phycisphaerae bacterium]
MHVCDGFFYYPNNHSYGSPEKLGLQYEHVVIPTRDGLQLLGWFFPACTNQSNCRQAHGTVLHLHGNAGNMSGHFQHVAWLAAAGWNVLCFDYRGYGSSRASVTRAGTIIDAHAALDYLLQRRDVDTQRIVALGQSLGGAIGIVLTADRPEIRGLATDGTFDRYRSIASWHIRQNPWLMPVAWWVPNVLMSRDYDPVDSIGRISPRPLLIIHGTDDEIVPVRMAHSLYGAAHEPKQLWLVDGADHYDPLRADNNGGRTKLIGFFADCVGCL